MRILLGALALLLGFLPAAARAQSTPCTNDTCADLLVETVPLGGVTPYAGGPVKWLTKVRNHGPAAATAKVENALPAGPQTYWTCIAIGGANCGPRAMGQASIAETVTLPMGAELDYQIEVPSSPCARTAADGHNLATVTAVDKTDPNQSNNRDERYVTGFRVEAQLTLSVDDGKQTATAGETLSYTVRLGNQGPSCAKGLTIDAPALPAFTGMTWTCSGQGGATCPAAQGTGALRQGPFVPPQGEAIYTLRATLNPSFLGTVTFPVSAANSEVGNVTRAAAADTTQVARGLDCSAARASVETLWPPDHRMVVVSVIGAPAPAKVVSVKQDEPVDDAGDGSTGADATVSPDGTAQVRAERSGGGDGRVYHLGFEATDPSGARCQGEVKTCVPHSEGKACVDGGALHESTMRLVVPPRPVRPGLIKRK